MFQDIQFVERFKLSFKKQEWSEAEIDLVRSLGFKITGQTIVVDLTITCKRALFEFLTSCFSRVLDDPKHKDAKTRLYNQLAERYGDLHKHFDTTYLKKLPYYGKLYKHQKELIYFSASRKYSLLAAEQGLGKTITAASVSICLDIKRTLIICPSVVKWSWFRDLTSETFGFHPMYFTIMDAVKGRGIKAFQEKFILINYDILNKYKTLLTELEIGHIILDECHYLKGNTIRFKNVLELIRHHKSAKVTLLSGTPVKNRINDIFNYLKLSEHNIGENHSKFLRDYTFFSKGRMGLRVTGGKNLGTLYKHICNLMLRKTKEECLDLPDKIVTKYYFQLNEYRKEYDEAIAELAKQKDISAIHSSLHTLNIIVSKSKIKSIIELAEQIVIQGRKPIIFAGYNAPLDLLQEHFKTRCVRIDGSVNSYDRDQLITRFKTDDSCEVFLGNIQAAGIGINLTNSCDVIFCSLPFTPTEVDQCIDRTHRINQKNVVNVYHTICEGSIDEHLFDMLVDKSQDINSLVNRNNHAFQMTSIQDKLFNKLLSDYKKNNLSLKCNPIKEIEKIPQ